MLALLKVVLVSPGLVFGLRQAASVIIRKRPDAPAVPWNTSSAAVKIDTP
jgi:hypothetical protein